MHAILTSIGTDGDIIPYLGLGVELRRRGHRVTLAVAEPWRETATRLGMEFFPIVSAQEDREMLENPDFWHPIKGAMALAKWGSRLFERQYGDLAKLCDRPEAVMVTTVGLIAARMVNEKFGIPMAQLILQPWMIKSLIEPPVMPAGLSLPRWAPRVVGRAYWRLLDATVLLLIGKELNRLRGSLGMRPVRRVYEWWLSEELVIGMFPQWYGPPQADWIGQPKLVGFPLFDGSADGELSEEARNFCQEGEKPIAFTFGTGMLHGEKLFRMAIDVCARLGTRGLLLSKYRDQLPGELPGSMLWCRFAPFQKLFPMCAAVVHHGGVGTTAKALAAGTPQLLIPMAYDQVDNAMRVARLGVGGWVKPRKANPVRVVAALEALLAPDVKGRCEEVARRFAGENALGHAADWVEALHGGSR